MKKPFLFLMMSSFAFSSLAQAENMKKAVVGISLTKVMEAVSLEQEVLRGEEPPAAILLFTADDRVREAATKIATLLRDYEQDRKVRVDFLTAHQDLPDYTEDFLKHWEEHHGE